ncbi:MAG: hypothetical protein AB1635_11655 [Acidobacteriota bacterium]
MFFKFRRMRAMDPLQVAMTGVRMGERFLQIGCDDAALVSGLATKVGLSGAAALVALDERQATRAAAAAAKVGALVDVKTIATGDVPFERGVFDMVVVDDTQGRFAGLAPDVRRALVAGARLALRPGGRVELVEGLGGGLFAAAPVRPAGYQAEAALAEGGFAPVRVLAEKDGFRFVEGLNPAMPAA